MSVVNRELFLMALESVSPGLAKREVLEQSSCLVFKEGQIVTFNDEISCKTASHIDPKIEGAVQAGGFMDILRKLPDEEVDISSTGDQIIVKGKRRKYKDRWEAKILLPIEHVETPETWSKLNPDFCEAINVVQQCAEKDESVFSLTCVHIHPKWVEACSNIQLCRWKMKTGVKEATIVRRSSIKHITAMGVTEFSETPNWLHFRNENGTVLSCRRYMDTKDFPSLTELLVVEGSPLTIPDSIEEIVARAVVCSSQNSDENNVRVVMAPGKFKLVGEGVTSSYEEFRKWSYTGPELDFLISPELLVNLSQKHRDCVVSDDKLMVDTGKYRYVTCLAKSVVKEEVSEEAA